MENTLNSRMSKGNQINQTYANGKVKYIEQANAKSYGIIH